MKYTSEEIKNRLSNIGEAIGNIALDYITDLEKENAELKKWQKDTIKARGNDYMDWSRMKDQLTKAKKIIKNLMVFAEMDDREYEKEYKEAEQFLKEVEK